MKGSYDIEASLLSLSGSTTPVPTTAKEDRLQDSPVTPRGTSIATTLCPVEVPRNVSHALDEKGLDADSFGVVRWKEYTKQHPRQWSLGRKIYDSIVICFMEFTMTVVSNIGSSIVPYALPELGIGEELGLCYFTTLYLLGQAFGGLILPPIAESFGTQSIYTTSIVGFAASNVIIGFCPTSPVIAVFRFVSGFLSAAPALVAASSIENMWDAKARIWLIHIWISCAVLALALGPSIATAVSESHLGWHWLFYLATIAGGALSVLCMLMKESRPSQLLRQSVEDIKHEHDFRKLSVDDSNCKPDAKTFMQTCLTMPIRLFFTEPIITSTSIMGATVYGVTYLFTAALSEVYVQEFGFTPVQGSLVFVAIGLGVLFTVLPRIYDIRALSHKETKDIEPEDKLFGFYVAAPVLAIGLWWFAFSVPPLVDHVSAWASITSLLLFGYSVVEFDNVLSGYLCDTYASHAASAIAPMSFLRALLSGLFPLFGASMFRSLGTSYAMFVLAGLATAFCGIAVGFRLYGKKIREKSPRADKTGTPSRM